VFLHVKTVDTYNYHSDLDCYHSENIQSPATHPKLLDQISQSLLISSCFLPLLLPDGDFMYKVYRAHHTPE